MDTECVETNGRLRPSAGWRAALALLLLVLAGCTSAMPAGAPAVTPAAMPTPARLRLYEFYSPT